MDIVLFKYYESSTDLKSLLATSGINGKIIYSYKYISFLKKYVKGRIVSETDHFISLEDMTEQKTIDYNIISKNKFDSGERYPAFMGYNYDDTDTYYPGLIFTFYFKCDPKNVKDIVSFSKYHNELEKIEKELYNTMGKYEKTNYTIKVNGDGIIVNGTIVYEEYPIDNKDIEAMLLDILTKGERD